MMMENHAFMLKWIMLAGLSLAFGFIFLRTRRRNPYFAIIGASAYGPANPPVDIGEYDNFLKFFGGEKE